MRKAAQKRRLEEGDILTIEDVAKLLGVSRTTVKRLMNLQVNPLPSFTVCALRKVDRREFDTWLAQEKERQREERNNIKPIRKAQSGEGG